MSEEKQLLETILVAEVLILAKTLELNTKVSNKTVAGVNYIDEAAREIKTNRPQLIALLRQ